MPEQETDAKMLEETARVVEACGGVLVVETQRRSGCNHCSVSQCTASGVAKLFGVRHNRLRLENRLGAGVGDRVVIGISDRLLVRASLMAYLLPLLALLSASALGDLAGLHEGELSLLALAGLAMGLLTVRWVSRSGSAQRYQPRLLRIVVPGFQRIEAPTLTRSSSNE